MSNGKHRLVGWTRRTRLAIVGGAAVVLTVASLTVPGARGEAAAEPADDGNWVTAWSAAPQGPSTLGDFGAELLSGSQQVTAVQGIVPPPTTFSDETIRQVLYLHHGGTAVRVQLSNEFGDRDATFPAVTVGVRDGDSGAAVEPGTQRDVTFDGEPAVTIPQGGTVLSDPVDLATEAFDHLLLSIFVPAGNGAATVHGSHMQTFFTTAGDATAAEGDGGFAERGVVLNNYTATLTTASYYATGVQVEGEPGDRTLVAFGDSITDGFLSTGNTDSRYPDVLARRLKADPATAHLSVTSQAISGGRVTGDGIGPSGLSRIDEQILAQPNLGGVIFLQGINDLGTAALQGLPATADDLIAAYREIADRVHAAGVPIYIGTLTPAGNLLRPTPYGVYSIPSQVAERNATNEWLRTEGREVFDGVVDFDAVIRDPLVPDWIALQYDALDNLHPNDNGYRAMAESIPQEFLDEIAAG